MHSQIKSMTVAILCIFLAGATFFVLSDRQSLAQQTSPSRTQEAGAAKASTFMRLKLEPAKAVLEGIALADFEMISKNAGAIHNLMLDESWMVIQSDEYRHQSNEFRTIIEQLQQAAKDKNVDRATFSLCSNDHPLRAVPRTAPQVMICDKQCSGLLSQHNQSTYEITSPPDRVARAR